MPVKRIHSVSRALSVLDAIAEHQPIGVSELAKLLDDNISALQRIIVTPADEGWIRAAPGKPTRWELTAHIHTVAYRGHGHNSLRQRTRATLEALRDRSGESVMLAVPDNNRLVSVDVVECVHLLRIVPRIGSIIPPRESATGHAVLAYMAPERQAALLGGPPDAALQAILTTVRRQGYALNEGAIEPGAVAVAAAILDPDGQPAAAISIAGPAERMTRNVQQRIGTLVFEAARDLSRSPLFTAA